LNCAASSTTVDWVEPVLTPDRVDAPCCGAHKEDVADAKSVDRNSTEDGYPPSLATLTLRIVFDRLNHAYEHFDLTFGSLPRDRDGFPMLSPLIASPNVGFIIIADVKLADHASLGFSPSGPTLEQPN
jgi:hypothetical protein